MKVTRTKALLVALAVLSVLLLACASSKAEYWHGVARKIERAVPSFDVLYLHLNDKNTLCAGIAVNDEVEIDSALVGFGNDLLSAYVDEKSEYMIVFYLRAPQSNNDQYEIKVMSFCEARDGTVLGCQNVRMEGAGWLTRELERWPGRGL